MSGPLHQMGFCGWLPDRPAAFRLCSPPQLSSAGTLLHPDFNREKTSTLHTVLSSIFLTLSEVGSGSSKNVPVRSWSPTPGFRIRLRVTPIQSQISLCAYLISNGLQCTVWVSVENTLNFLIQCFGSA
jgi:hypothetical protein